MNSTIPSVLKLRYGAGGRSRRSVCREVADRYQPHAIALIVLAANYKREQGRCPALFFLPVWTYVDVSYH